MMPTTRITQGTVNTVNTLWRITLDGSILIGGGRMKWIGSAAGNGAPVKVLGFGGCCAAASRKTEEAAAFCAGEHEAWTIPNLDSRGAPLGIDIRLVVKTGVTPILDTATAHRNGGKIGIGEARAPMEAFESALRAFAHVVEGQAPGA